MNVSTLITLISPVPRVPDNFLPKDLNRPPLSASNLIVTTRKNAGLSGADMHIYALTVKAVTQEAVAPSEDCQIKIGHGQSLHHLDVENSETI